MSKIEQRYQEDRELRDAARAVLMADIDHARESFSAKGVVTRVGSRISDGAVDVFETAKDQASDKRGVIAALVGAVLLWLGREPILEALGLSEPTEDETPEEEPTESEAAEPAAQQIPPGDDDEH